MHSSIRLSLGLGLSLSLCLRLGLCSCHGIGLGLMDDSLHDGLLVGVQVLGQTVVQGRLLLLQFCVQSAWRALDAAHGIDILSNASRKSP